MARPASTGTTWRTLAAVDRRPEPFDRSTLDHLPVPAARWLGRALPEGTPLVEGVSITMAGEIRIGSWMPFTAEQILRAGVGFVWKPVVGGRLLRFVGADVLGPDEARMEFRLHGLIPVARSSGPDTARSAAGRLAAETIAWLPQAATPQAGTTWTGVDDRHAEATIATPDGPVDVRIGVADDGRITELSLDRWNDSADPPAFESFGGDITDEYVTDSGVRVAGAGRVGWGRNEPAWPAGEFFRYRIETVEPLRVP